MIGAIIGDIVGSRFEFHNHKSKDFPLFTKYGCKFTDDTVMTIAVGNSIMLYQEHGGSLGKITENMMKSIAKHYPNAGYGRGFSLWLKSKRLGPYNSWGNGGAMRVSACGWMGKDLDECLDYAQKVTEITHNHPEGIKGAKAVTTAIYLARCGNSMENIKKAITGVYYDIDFTLDEIRDSYEFSETSQDSVPQALECFFESTSFEDCLRNAISIGGDSDTIAAIACSIAEAYWGVPYEINLEARTYLDKILLDGLDNIEKKYPSNFLEE